MNDYGKGTVIPQAYPLFAAMTYMAGDGDVKYNDRTCQHRPTCDDVYTGRIIAWYLPTMDFDLMPVPIVDEGIGLLEGYRFEIFDTATEAKSHAEEMCAEIDRYWDRHKACYTTDHPICEAQP